MAMVRGPMRSTLRTQQAISAMSATRKVTSRETGRVKTGGRMAWIFCTARLAPSRRSRQATLGCRLAAAKRPSDSLTTIFSAWGAICACSRDPGVGFLGQEEPPLSVFGLALDDLLPGHDAAGTFNIG